MKENILTKRSPIIAVVGHIDHGKSTLLDYIRKSNVAEKEAGGITQHIGAYEVLYETPQGAKERLTFLDTPGHEAFSKMRERGAKIADIIILVVAADDKVNVQTVEAIKVIKEAKTPFIVAINKTDKPTANVENIKQELAANDVFLEGYGGDVPNTLISAKTGEGMSELLSMLLLMADLEELKKDDRQNAEGVVVESKIDPRAGATATLIVKNGTLKTGDLLIINGMISPVRVMKDSDGQVKTETTASSPILVMGLGEPPAVSSSFISTKNKKEAELLAQKQLDILKEEKEKEKIEEGKYKVTLPLVIKSDFLGTLEAVEKEVKKLETEEVKIKIVSTGVGTINETDIKLAGGHMDLIITGFNVKTDRSAKDLAEKLGIVEPKTFNIIYDIIPYLEEIIKERMPKDEKEIPIGIAKILKTFGGSKERQIVGGKITNGHIENNLTISIIRQNKALDRGKIISLQQNKNKVESVPEGEQFGAMINSKITIAAGDSFEIFAKQPNV